MTGYSRAFTDWRSRAGTFTLGSLAGLNRHGKPGADYELICHPDQVPEGTELVQAEDSLLLVDLDTRDGLRQLIRTLPMVDEMYGIYRIELWESRHGNLHASVRIGYALGRAERVGVQAILGSDPKRELLGMECARRGEDSSCLFRPVVGR